MRKFPEQTLDMKNQLPNLIWAFAAFIRNAPTAIRASLCGIAIITFRCSTASSGQPSMTFSKQARPGDVRYIASVCIIPKCVPALDLIAGLHACLPKIAVGVYTVPSAWRRHCISHRDQCLNWFIKQPPNPCRQGQWERVNCACRTQLCHVSWQSEIVSLL